MERQLISEENGFLWSSRVDVKGETESEIISDQDQAKILQTQTDGRYRLCQQFNEILDRIISASAILVKEQYIKICDRVCAQLHFNICKQIRVKLGKKLLV